MTFAEATTTDRTVIRCSVGAFLRELADKNPVEAQLFIDKWLLAKNNRGWAVADSLIHTKIVEEVALHGYETVVSKRSINPHRRTPRGCSCAEDAA
jgi:hypothetical protein